MNKDTKQKLNKLKYWETQINVLKDQIGFYNMYFMNTDNDYALGIYDGIEYVISILDERIPEFYKDFEPFKSKIIAAVETIKNKKKIIKKKEKKNNV